MTKAKRTSLRGVGVACILMSVAGIFYTVNYYYAIYSDPQAIEQLSLELEEDISYFDFVYHVMIVICLCFYLALAYLGASFWRMETKYRYWFLALMTVEIAYFLSLGSLWQLENQSLAMSIAAATGVANGGLVAQGITLFPIWAAIIIFWAHSNNRLQNDAATPRA